MGRNQKKSSLTGTFMVMLVFINAVILKEGLMTSASLYGLLWLSIPLLLITVFEARRKISKRS